MIKASIRSNALAKINLFLHVTGKRVDGYHYLESLVGFADFAHDVLTIQNAPDFSFEVVGPFAPELEEQEERKNLVVMMHDLLQNFTGRPLPCYMKLEKNLPIGSGLGGGSSDAASALKLMESFFNLSLNENMKRHLMVMIGADVPVCYTKQTSYFSGIGEIIEPAPDLPPTPMLLVWPGISCSTQQIFEARPEGATSIPVNRPASFENLQGLVEFLNHTGNDLAAAAEYIHPQITTTRHWMEEQDGCLLARMSGSGAAIFGIFQDEELAQRALESMPVDKNWWGKAGILT